MISPFPSPGWQLLGILWLGSVTHVAASLHTIRLKQRSGEDIDELFKNNRGQSPCDLGQALVAPCPSNDDDISSPTPSNCSCNNVYFNVRSACLLSEGGSTSQPNFSDWNNACQQQSISVTTGYPSQLLKGSSNITVPYWALVSVGSNGEFDYVNAANLAKPRAWTTMQMILPIMSAAGTLIVVALAFLCIRYRPSMRRVHPRDLRHWPKAHLPARIRTMNKSDSLWTIDHPQPSGPNTASYPNAEYGTSTHVQIPSQESFQILDKPHSEEHEAISGDQSGTWNRLAQKVRRFPSPFKPKAISIQDAPPTRSFRINSVDASSAGHSLTSGRRSGRTEPSDLPARWRGLITVDDEFLGSSDGHRTMEEEELDSLISHTERSEGHVFLVTNRNTTNSSARTTTERSSHISSGVVKIEPPTPTATSSRHSARQSSPPGPPPLSPLPPVPPAPRMPPPPPPPGSGTRLPPTPQRGRPPEESIRIQLQPPPTGSPQSTTPPKQPSPASLPFQPTILYQNLHSRRERSFDDQNSDAGGGSVRARPMGARSPARPGPLRLPPLPADSDSDPTTMPTAANSAQRPSHRRALSAGDEHPTDIYHYQPLAVPPTHQRNWSAESVTPGPPLGDPLHLFPMSVRSASRYGTHIANVTESSGSLYSQVMAQAAETSGALRQPPDIHHGRSRS